MTTVTQQAPAQQTATYEVKVDTQLPFSAFLKPANVGEGIASRNFPAGDWSS